MRERAEKMEDEEKKDKNDEDEKYAPPTLSNAVANKLGLVLSIHPHPPSDVQAFVPPMPMPPLLLLEVEVEVEEGVPGEIGLASY
jgi:hypothetical protein